MQVSSGALEMWMVRLQRVCLSALIEYVSKVGYVKFSAKTGWNWGGGSRSRLEVWQRETQCYCDEIMPKVFQPEDYLYAPCYLCVGMSQEFISTLHVHDVVCTM